ncbi:MAG: type II toxin-antitoxin system RelE/ParE family toxin [Oscillospiraceae bacterium]|nr:type II toxin-antitoxin system RelE/ParE family toxin [Oscillospiraceae bacterium]
MKWTVDYTEDAERDLDNIYEYIANVRLESAAASRVVKELMEAADSLDFMPLRYPSYPDEPWKSKGLRILYKHKYAILYYPDESAGIISILRIIYGGRDVSEELKHW